MDENKWELWVKISTFKLFTRRKYLNNYQSKGIYTRNIWIGFSAYLEELSAKNWTHSHPDKYKTVERKKLSFCQGFKFLAFCVYVSILQRVINYSGVNWTGSWIVYCVQLCKNTRKILETSQKAGDFKQIDEACRTNSHVTQILFTM